MIPRVLSAAEWDTIERGVIQRVTALNRFIEDIYHKQKILRDGIVPADLVLGNANYRAQMRDLKVPFGSYVNICGIDIVRGGDGRFCVLEDNARTPSGVSYVVENRHLTQRAFPDLMRNIGVRSVSNYGQRLAGKLTELAAEIGEDPSVVLLSPGVYNSAYFEHVFLAREMGVPLVEGRDLIVRDDRVFMKTTGGLQRVNVIYRRIDDDFLDPEVFNPQSMLGVRGLMRAYRAGHVVLANAVGTGIADDKAVYAYVPRIIRYYLDEDAILPNVETHICREADWPRVHAREPRAAGGQAGRRVGRLRDPDWSAREPQGTGRVPAQAARGSRQLHQPAGGAAVGVPDGHSQRHRAAARGPAPVRGHRPLDVGAAWRTHPRGIAQGIVDRQLVAGRRLEGYLGP